MPVTKALNLSDNRVNPQKSLRFLSKPEAFLWIKLSCVRQKTGQSGSPIEKLMLKIITKS